MGIGFPTIPGGGWAVEWAAWKPKFVNKLLGNLKMERCRM